MRRGETRRIRLAPSVLVFLVVLLGILFHTPWVKGSTTIFIRPDGSVDPTDAPILNDGNDTYILTDDVYDSIVVERDNIVIDGTNYVVQGTHSGTGIDLSGRNNVTLKNTKITKFAKGIWLEFSNNSILINNTISDNYLGIYVEFSVNNNLSDNFASNNRYGIWLYSSNSNALFRNTVLNNNYGVGLESSSNNNTLSNNIVSSNRYYGVGLISSNNNTLFHNNFTNIDQVYPFEAYDNVWDDGYPSGGNYWSDYDGGDVKSGPYQNETGSDGIGDTSYTIDAANQDHYPLIRLRLHHDLVVSMTTPASVRVGESSVLNATVTNEGKNDEVEVELSLLINGTVVNSTTIPLLKANFLYTLSYKWMPEAEGTYNVTAYATPVIGEPFIENNEMTKFVNVIVSPRLPIDPTVLYILIIVAIILVAAATFFIIRKKKKPTEKIARFQS